MSVPHRERVRSVDKLIGKWDGTGQVKVKERGKDMGTFDKVPLTGGKSYYNKQEGIGGNRPIYPTD